jgi:hypothetical protein
MTAGDLVRINITGGRVRKGMVATYVEDVSETLGRIELPDNLGKVIIKKENIIPTSVFDTQNEELRRKNCLENLSTIEPAEIPSTDFEYLASVKPLVTVRFSWPPFMHDAVLQRFQKLGKPLPLDARPMNSGAKGGKPMYGLSCEVKVDGEEYFSKVSYGLTLYLEGFNLTYAKKEN